MHEIDIWRAADQMVKVYGVDADLHASMRANRATHQGDQEGGRVWKRVVEAILQLDRQRPILNQPLN